MARSCLTSIAALFRTGSRGRPTRKEVVGLVVGVASSCVMVLLGVHELRYGDRHYQAPIGPTGVIAGSVALLAFVWAGVDMLRRSRK